MSVITIVLLLSFVAVSSQKELYRPQTILTEHYKWAEEVCILDRSNETLIKNHCAASGAAAAPDRPVDANNQLAAAAITHHTRLELPVHEYIYEYDSFHERFNISHTALIGLQSNQELNEYSYLTLHNYEDVEEMRIAAGQEVDQEKCIRQLTELNERVEKQILEKQSSKDLNIAQLLDAFGHKPPGHHLGNFLWEGSYRQCRKLRIDSKSEGYSIGTRYCVGLFKDASWPSTVDGSAIHIGACLPESCDSMNYKNKFELIERLVDIKAQEVDKGAYKIRDLYCLPDERSPLRSIWRDPRTVLAIVVIICWIGLLVYATLMDCQSSVDDGSWVKSFSIVNNLTRLFNTQEQSQNTYRPGTANFDIFESIKVIGMSYVILGHVVMLFTGGLIDGRQLSTNPAFLIANLAPAFAVNSFFAMTGILTAYLLLKQNRTRPFLTNPIKWAAVILYRYIRIVPMYLLIVLYSKTLAKYSNSGPFWDYGTSTQSHRRRCEQESILWTLLLAANFKTPIDHCLPGGWYLANDFQFFLISPLFLILIERYPRFAKRFLFSGILISILASMLSILTAEHSDLRPIARFEPHAFKTYVTHLSHSYTRPYYRVPAYLIGLYVGHLICQAEQATNRVRSEESSEQKTMAYTDEGSYWPLCRKLCWTMLIVPVIIALLGLQFHGIIANIVLGSVITIYLTVVYLGLSLVLSYKHRNAAANVKDQPDRFERYSGLVSLTIINSCCLTPFVSSSISLTKTAARLSMSIILTIHNFSFALAICLIALYSTTTRQRSRSLIHQILTAPQWKVLSRLSLCALLLNVEVIAYIAGGRENLHPLTHQYLWAMNIVSVMTTYIVSFFANVLVESPIQGSMRRMIPLLIRANDTIQQSQSGKQFSKSQYDHCQTQQADAINNTKTI